MPCVCGNKIYNIMDIVQFNPASLWFFSILISSTFYRILVALNFKNSIEKIRTIILGARKIRATVSSTGSYNHDSWFFHKKHCFWEKKFENLSRPRALDPVSGRQISLSYSRVLQTLLIWLYLLHRFYFIIMLIIELYLLFLRINYTANTIISHKVEQT